MDLELQEKVHAVINLGSSHITGMLATKHSNGVIAPRSYRSKPSRGAIVHGRIHNIHQSAALIADIIAELEADLPQGQRIEGVYVGLDCRSLQSKPYTASLSLTGGAVIEEAHLRQLREQARKVTYSDLEVVRIIDPRYYVDGKSEATPRGVRGTYLEAKYQLIVVRRGVVENIRQVFEHQLGLTIHDILIAPLAEASLTLSSEESILGCVYVNMGGGTTTISVYEERRLTGLYTIPLGGINVTRDLTHLGLIEEHAELLKVRHGSMRTNVSASEMITDVDLGFDRQLSQLEVNRYVSARMIEILGSIFSVLQHSTAVRHESMTMIFSGGVTYTDHLLQTLAQQFRGVKVRRGFVRSEFVSEAFDSELIPEYSTALALVAQATEDCLARVRSMEAVFGADVPDEPEQEPAAEQTALDHEYTFTSETPAEHIAAPEYLDPEDEEDYEDDEEDDDDHDDRAQRGASWFERASSRFAKSFSGLVDKLNSGGDN